MRFGKKLRAAIERGEWVRRRSWHKGFKMRKRDEGFFVDERGFIASLGPADIFATDWVIVRRKARKARKADDPRYEPVETMPIVGDKVAHPNDGGRYPSLTVEKILEAGDAHRWVVKANGTACSLNKSGAGWRILKRRNVFKDPRLGDVIGRDHLRAEVRFVDAEVVMLRWNNGSFCAVVRESLATYATVGWTVRKLGS